MLGTSKADTGAKEAAVMKYVVCWTARESRTSEQDATRSLAVFGKWAPSNGSTMHQFVQRVDGEGGFAIVETNDPADVLRDTYKFTPWFKYEVFPVVDMAEATSLATEAIDYRSSIS
jgi:hypothetical protein